MPRKPKKQNPKIKLDYEKVLKTLEDVLKKKTGLMEEKLSLIQDKQEKIDRIINEQIQFNSFLVGLIIDTLASTTPAKNNELKNNIEKQSKDEPQKIKKEGGFIHYEVLREKGVLPKEEESKFREELRDILTKYEINSLTVSIYKSWR